MADTRTEVEVLIWNVPHTVLIEPEDAAAWYAPDEFGNGTVTPEE